jgi:glyoxylase I family protein
MPVKLAKDAIDVGLVTSNYESAHRFYGEVLGFEMVRKIELDGIGTIYRYAVGKSILRIFLPIEPPTLKNQPGEIRYMTILVDDLESIVAEISAAGFTVVVPIRQLRPGVKVALIQDADLNAIELMNEYPPSGQ